MGRRRFGTIFRCFSFAAYKVIDKRRPSNATYRQCLVNEPKLMTLLSPHHHILRILDGHETDDRLSLMLELCEPDTRYDRILVLELCEHDALYDRILSRKALTDPLAATCMVQILCVLAHCYCLSIVNRDVKPEDVLFDSRDVLKLARFGSATWLHDGGPVEGVEGTPYSVSPEVLMRWEYGEEVDILYNILAVAKEFFSKMICRDVSRRISAEQALRHP
ncbi:hypothetical protein EUGRSUZ_H04243 [Eucalyptus grandis]|uniref:Uncharacterized protein n=2 Tax=Eucalyptus grandis TaxID=71139 RepID=A0ACC3JYM4_EUCGR|nr:hypothetical protein EUGRSUZ_H04243 [Eucalyptus grandis]